MAEARAALGAYVGADADDLVYVPNVTAGLNIVARSLDLARGDEVLATDHEYGALDRTRVLFLSHVTSPNAIILPIAELVRRALEAVTITIVDGAHALGQIQRACRELVRTARRAIAELTGLPSITPDAPDWFAQMAAFPLPPCDGQDLQRRLYEQFRIEVPVTTWNGSHFVRISIQGYNTRADVDALVEGLGELAPP